MAKIKWGMVCSVPEKSLMAKLEEFGCWLVENLETSASLLHLFHQFAEKPNFVFYCEPGNESMVEDAYAKIHELYPDVLYVIQILPFKNAREFTLLKSLTLKYALIGQGILIDSALTRFSGVCSSSIVMNGMNQWFSRRISQLVSRHKESDFQLLVHGKDLAQPKVDVTRDFEPSVEAILHSFIEVDDDMDRMVIIEGFPAIFNKFQVASLFPEFRPKNVLRAAGNQAIVEFENKFHAAQVIFSHCRGVKFPDEGFTLVARPHPFSQDPNACKEALRKKLLIIASQQDGQEKSKSCDVENDENAASKTK